MHHSIAALLCLIIFGCGRTQSTPNDKFVVEPAGIESAQTPDRAPSAIELGPKKLDKVAKSIEGKDVSIWGIVSDDITDAVYSEAEVLSEDGARHKRQPPARHLHPQRRRTRPYQ